jgi:hypothetical protein
VVSHQAVGMSRIIKRARTGLAAGAVTLLMSHGAFAAQINIHVPTPVIHVPTPVIHLPTPTVRVIVPSAHIKTPEINAGASSNHTLEGGAHGLVSRDNQNALKSTNRQLQKDINNSGTSTSLPKQTSTISTQTSTVSTPMGLSTVALPGPASAGTPSGGGGIGGSELAALLGKDRINSAFSFHPSRPSVYPGTGGPSFYSGGFPMPEPDPNAQAYDTVKTVLYRKPLPKGETYLRLIGIRDDLKGDLDSMYEMSEMTSMRLQMAMDRRSAFVQTLSNMLKKIDKSQEAIIQNMK